MNTTATATAAVHSLFGLSLSIRLVSRYAAAPLWPSADAVRMTPRVGLNARNVPSLVARQETRAVT